jgi:hypothetical protein
LAHRELNPGVLALAAAGVKRAAEQLPKVDRWRVLSGVRRETGKE